MMHRTRFILGGAALATVLALSACAPPSGLSGDGASDATAADDTYTVGVLAPMTSWAGALGLDWQQGWEMYWEEHGTTIGDFEIETVWEDTASSPDTALTKARLLVEESAVDTVIGPILASESLVVGDYLARAGVANLANGGDDVTQRLADPHIIRVGSFGASQMTFGAGKWAADQGYATAATLCADYAFGWESCGGFVSAFGDEGGTVTEQFWYPGDAADLSGYVTQLGNLDVDVIFVGSAGGTDSSNFLRAANDFGLLTGTPIINNCCTTDQAILADVGDIALGQMSVSNFAEGSDDPAIAAFVKDYEERYGVLPSAGAYGMYATAQILTQALESSPEKLTGEALVTAIKDVDLTSTIYGGGSIDEWGNPVGPIYVREVTKRADGVLWNTIVDVIPDVSQFWTFDPDAYLANPPFTQEFQQQ